MSQRKFERNARRRSQATQRRDTRRRRQAGLAAGAVGAAVLFAPSAASAETFVVDKLGDGVPTGTCTAAADDCTLREAINEANTGAGDDTITFANTVTGTIVLTQGQLSINPANPGEGLTITGPGASQLTVDGNNESRVFDITNSNSVNISGLTLTRGNGTPDAGNADVQGDGGAINTEAELNLVDSVITGSSAVSGGGVATSDDGANLDVVDTAVTGNSATNHGGGVRSEASLQLTDSRVSGNTAVNGGGGIAQVPLESRFNFKYLRTDDTTIAGNTAGNGGGVMVDGSATKYTDIVQTTISGNTASGPGGGVDFVTLSTDGETIDGAANIVNSTIAGNQGTIGGGIHAGHENIIAARAAQARASAENGDRHLDVSNSTVASNTATSTGGGIALQDFSTQDDEVGLNSTIVADNNADTGDKDLHTASGTAETFNSQHSLVETPGAAALTTDAGAPTITGQDPQLGALANNGGPTQTKLPAASSPAIDKGDNPDSLTEEQRHTARTINLATANATGGDGTDIGAVEIPVPTSTTTITPPPPLPVTPSATPTICGRRAISLVRADRRGSKVRLSGLVGTSLYGKRVTIQTDPKGARSSAFTRTTTVTASRRNGAFTASVPKPKAGDVVSVRYRAVVGRNRSPALKLPQSLTSRSVKSAKGTITVKGRVKKSVLGKRNRVKIRRLVCGRYRTVGTAKPDANGNYSVTFRSTALRGVSFYRAESMVLRKPGSKVYVIQYARAIAIRVTSQTG